MYYNFKSAIYVLILLLFVSRFMLMFKGIRGLRFKGDIALDDVTLSPECFGKGNWKRLTNIAVSLVCVDLYPINLYIGISVEMIHRLAFV